MISLGIETSTASGSIALFSDEKILGSCQWSRSGSHSEFITSSFQDLLRQQNLDAKKIQRIGVGIGPGSFTGIRVGINFARALAYVLNIKVFNCNSLQLLCYQPGLLTKKNFRVLVIQYAFRDIVYSCEYEIDQNTVTPTTEVQALAAEKLSSVITRPILVLGTGYEALKSRLDHSQLALCIRDSSYYDLPRASDFVFSPLTAASENHLSAWNQTIPLYIRASEAEEKLRQRLL